MSVNVYFADYSASTERPTFSFAGRSDWDPRWQTVEDIRRWAASRSPRPLNVEVFAGEHLVSQLSEVGRFEGSIRVIEWTPRSVRGQTDPPRRYLWSLEVYVY